MGPASGAFGLSGFYETADTKQRPTDRNMEQTRTVSISSFSARAMSNGAIDEE